MPWNPNMILKPRHRRKRRRSGRKQLSLNKFCGIRTQRLHDAKSRAKELGTWNGNWAIRGLKLSDVRAYRAYRIRRKSSGSRILYSYSDCLGLCIRPPSKSCSCHETPAITPFPSLSHLLLVPLNDNPSR